MHAIKLSATPVPEGHVALARSDRQGAQCKLFVERSRSERSMDFIMRCSSNFIRFFREEHR